MRRRRISVSWATLAFGLLWALVPHRVAAQAPFIQAYYDDQFTVSTMNSPGIGVLDTVYVVAKNIGTSISSIEYSVDYSAGLTFIFDLFLAGNADGTTVGGVKHTWSGPISVTEPLLLATVLVQWTFSNCAIIDFICVNPLPNSGVIQATTESGPLLLTGKGSWICGVLGDPPITCWLAPVPVHETRWGQIKAMYR